MTNPVLELTCNHSIFDECKHWISHKALVKLYISVVCVFLKGEMKTQVRRMECLNECQISLFVLQRPPVLPSVALRWSTGLFQRILSTNWVVVQVETLPGTRGTAAKQRVVERSNYCSSLEPKDCRWDQEGNMYRTSQSIWIWVYIEHEKDTSPPLLIK